MMISKPDFVVKNSHSTETLRMERNLTTIALIRGTGIDYQAIMRYTTGYQIPDKEDYNKLAKFFGWQLWEE